MPFLLLILIVGLGFFADFRALGTLGQIVSYLPELLSGVLLAVLVIEAGRRKTFDLPPRYVALAGLMLLLMLLSVFYNTVDPATIVGGIRTYFKYLPVFIYPFVIPLQERQLKVLLGLLLLLLLIQFPIALYQLEYEFPKTRSGDVIRGTFGVGAIMSIMELMGIAMLIALAYRRVFGWLPALLLIPLLFYPTLINETKGTVLLLPLALFGVLVLGNRGSARLLGLAAGVFLALTMLSVFTLTYDSMFRQSGPSEGGIAEFFTEGEFLENLYKQKEAGSGKAVGRIDSILHAYDELSADPFELAVGKGIGNVAQPSLMGLLEGEFAEEYEIYEPTTNTISYLFWEVGLLGVFFVLVLVTFIGLDATRMSEESGLRGAVSLGWLGVVVMLPAAMVYKDLLHHSAPGILLALFSGFVAAERARLDHAALAPRPTGSGIPQRAYS